MTGKSRARRRNNSRNLFKNRGVDPGLQCSELEGLVLVQALKQNLEVFEYRFKFRVLKRKELFPIPPRSNKFPVVQIVLDQIVDDRKTYSCLRTGIGRYPEICMRRRIRQPCVKHDQFGTLGLCFDNSLRVWIEIVTGFQMRTDQEDNFCVCVVRAWTIQSHPVLIARSAIV